MSTQVAIGQNPHSQRFTYSSYPRPLYYSSYKNVNDSEKPFYGNIMYDKRVIRGSTWALKRLAQEATLVEEVEDRNQLKIKRNNIRQQIQAKLESHKASLSAKVQANGDKITATRKGPQRTKDGTKSNRASVQGSSSNDRSLNESALAVSEDNQKGQLEDMQMIEAQLRSDIDSSIHPSEFNFETIENDDKKTLKDQSNVDQLLNNGVAENDSLAEMISSNQSVLEMIDLKKQFVADEKTLINNENDGKIGQEKNETWDEQESIAMKSDQIDEKENSQQNEDFGQKTESGKITHLDTINEEDYASLETMNENNSNGESNLIDTQSSNKTIADRESRLLQLMATETELDLYPLPRIESFASEQKLYDDVSGKRLVQWTETNDEDDYEDQINQALKIIVDSAMSSATLELQYEIEIDELKSGHEQLIKDHARLLVKQEDTEQSLILIEEQKNQLAIQFEQLEQQKLKFISRQLAWEFVNNQLLPWSVEKFVQYSSNAPVEDLGYDEDIWLPNNEFVNQIQDGRFDENINDRGADEEVVGERSATVDIAQANDTIGNDFMPWLEQTNDKMINDSVELDFMPWMFTEVYSQVAHTTLSHWLDDTIDLNTSFCRSNAKKFFRSAIEKLTDN